MTTSDTRESTSQTEPEVAEDESPAPAEKRPRVRKLIAAALALVLACGASVAWLQSGRSILGVHAGEGPLAVLPTWLPDGVAFRYGDRAVTIDEFDRHVEMLRALYGVQPPEGDQVADFQRDAAKSYAVSLLLDDAARGRGIDVADKQARDTLSRFVSERLGQGPDAYRQFIATLTDSGTSERAVLGELKRRLAMTHLFGEITGDIDEPSDEEVRKAFAEREQDLAQPETRRINNIVVETRDDAEQVLHELSSGASFADVARRASLDSSTRDDGGKLGEVSSDQLEQAYADAAFQAGKGELFGPVQTQHGWNVGQVTAITASQPAEFRAVRDDLKQRLHAEAGLTVWRSWLREEIADAHIVYADQYRPADPDAPPTTPEDLAPGPQGGTR